MTTKILSTPTKRSSSSKSIKDPTVVSLTHQPMYQRDQLIRPVILNSLISRGEMSSVLRKVPNSHRFYQERAKWKGDLRLN